MRYGFEQADAGASLARNGQGAHNLGSRPLFISRAATLHLAGQYRSVRDSDQREAIALQPGRLTDASSGQHRWQFQLVLQ